MESRTMDELLTGSVTEGPQTEAVDIPLAATLSPWAGGILPRLLDELRQEYPRLTFSLVLDRVA
jgi:DNA-binding transcriptional LysR family regulator